MDADIIFVRLEPAGKLASVKMIFYKKYILVSLMNRIILYFVANVNRYFINIRHFATIDIKIKLLGFYENAYYTNCLKNLLNELYFCCNIRQLQCLRCLLTWSMNNGRQRSESRGKTILSERWDRTKTASRSFCCAKLFFGKRTIL